MKIFKKYDNRKIYDKQKNKYINLSNLAQLVYENENFIVLEHKTNKNVTEKVLKSMVINEIKDNHYSIGQLKTFIKNKTL